MKHGLYILIFLPLFTWGQNNLVPNGGFEEALACTSPALSQLAHWVNPNLASTDYFRGCGIYDLLVPPSVIYGSQWPHSGNAFVGGYSFSKSQPELREYIQTELTEPLDSGSYKVSFYVSLADDVIYSVSSMGAYLSEDAISSNDYWVLDVEPQIQNPSANQLSNTSEWVLITDTFVSPSGGERFITVGNFNTAATSDTLLHGAAGQITGSYAYYYIDDVSVVALGRPSGIDALDETTFAIYPNPATAFVRFKLTENTPAPSSIHVYDMVGRQVLAIPYQPVLDVSGLSLGNYVVAITVENNTYRQLLLVQ